MRPWLHGEGLSYQLDYALDELDTICRLVPGVEGVGAYRATLRALTSESNGRLFHLVEQSSLAFEAGDRSLLDADVARAYCEGVGARLVERRNRFIADNIYLLRDASRFDHSAGPVISPQLH